MYASQLQISASLNQAGERKISHNFYSLVKVSLTPRIKASSCSDIYRRLIRPATMTPMDMKVATRRLAPAALALVAAAGAAADTEALMAAEPNAEGEADTDAEGVEVLLMDVVATTRVLDSTLVGTAEEEADEFEVAALAV